MNNSIEWSKVKTITVVCDEINSTLELEYKKFNTLYSPKLDREYWFNNATGSGQRYTLTPYAYVGLCIFICTDNTTCILDKYDVVDIQLEEER